MFGDYDDYNPFDDPTDDLYGDDEEYYDDAEDDYDGEDDDYDDDDGEAGPGPS